MSNVKDGLNNLTQNDVANVAFRLIDTMQNFSPAQQVQAASVVFLLMIDVFGLDARQELARSERIMKNADRNWNFVFKSIRAYIEGELK